MLRQAGLGEPLPALGSRYDPEGEGLQFAKSVGGRVKNERFACGRNCKTRTAAFQRALELSINYLA